tara:strand:+ start:17167 stop:17478 length:312 start_codon:yes stop_codon:yes gene_type:complete
MSGYTSNIKRFCSVYKSSKKNQMYIYVDRSYKLENMPEALKGIFGQPIHVLDMILTPEKKLARVAAEKVLQSIEEQDFYLQMPPAESEVIEGAHSAPKDSLHG